MLLHGNQPDGCYRGPPPRRGTSGPRPEETFDASRGLPGTTLPLPPSWGMFAGPRPHPSLSEEEQGLEN